MLIRNKFSREVSVILTASDWTCRHFLNTMTFLLLFYIKYPWEEYSMTENLLSKQSRNERETEEGKPSHFSAVNMKVAVCIQLEVQEILSSALFPWHPFPTSLTGHLTLAGESPGGSSLWAVMATTGPWPQALDAHTCCVEVGFVTNPLPSADCCPLPVPFPVQRLREVISTRLFICIADLMVLFWLMVPGYSRKSRIKGPCYQWSKNQYPLFCLFQFSSGP